MNTTTCYCCDNISIGKGDHVPPLSFFPKGLFSNTEPIIVPSCPEHNQQKSNLDEYLKFILSSSSKFTPPHVLGSTVRGVVRQVQKNSKKLPNFGIERNDHGVFMEDSAPIDVPLLHEALRKIARGIYYHNSGGKKKLLGHLFVVPLFLGIDPQASDDERKRLVLIDEFTKQGVKEIEMHGEFNKFFCYQVIEDDGIIVINMIFYSDRVVSVMHQKI